MASGHIVGLVGRSRVVILRKQDAKASSSDGPTFLITGLETGMRAVLLPRLLLPRGVK